MSRADLFREILGIPRETIDMTPLTDIERDKLILASARATAWLISRHPYGTLSDEHVELEKALEKFPIIREAPPR